MRVGVDPGAPGGDHTAYTCGLNGGACIDPHGHCAKWPKACAKNDTVSADGMRPPTDVRDTLKAMVENDRKAQHAARSREEMRRAFALQQPQGLGLLFAGLRPKGQR